MSPVKSPLAASLALSTFLLPPALAAESPPITRVDMRLFEQADTGVLPFGRRVYQTHFDATRTRMIGLEIGAAYAKPAESSLLPVDCTLLRPDGSRSAPERAMSFQLLAGETHSNSANLLWGVAAEKDWMPGPYLVECASSGQPLGQAPFVMVQNPPDVADTDIRVAELRFFPLAAELPPRTERQYTRGFSAAETRRIGVEIEFTHAPLGRSVVVPVACHYYWPDGQVMAPARITYEPGPEWPGGFSAGNTGWDEPGQWPAGHYTVVCQVNGKPAAVDRFEVR